ncbi:MAG: mechanosensitive ion channel domain-containing protein [Candidatus Thorarchaeota archaeon]
MAIFRTDLEALIYVIIIGIGLYLVNWIISQSLDRIKKILPANKNKVNFIVRLFSIIILVYFLIEGFPSFTTIPAEYSVLISGAISTALAFATSEIFSNFISGLLLWILNPFNIGDVVKIKDHKGVIKSITLTKIIIETFDRIIVDMSNSDVLASTILNYTIKLKKIKNYYKFKRAIQSPQDISNARLNFNVFDDKMRKREENEFRALHESLLESKDSAIHAFTFSMRFPYERFRIKVNQTDKLCDRYKDIFGIKPKFHIFNYDFEIHVKFRILTLDSDKLLNYQADFANDIYKIILTK